MDIKILLLGILGNALSVLSFAAPMPTFWRICKNGTTESFDSTPYTCILLNCMIWVYYTIIKRNELLVLVLNAIGCAFQCLYLSLYLFFASRRQKIWTTISLFFTSIIFASFLLVMIFIVPEHKRLLVTGIISCTSAVLMYGSPLSIIGTVIRTRSIEFMPFLLSLSIFLRSVAWFGYSFMIKDLFIEVPTIIGTILGAFQIIIYMFYKYIVKKVDSSLVVEP